MVLLYIYNNNNQGRHALIILIIFEGARVRGGGTRNLTYSSHNSLCFILFFPFYSEKKPHVLTKS